MDWKEIVGLLGTVASIIGAIVSLCQSKKAISAKEATEAARDKFFQNIQHEDFVIFQKECDKFCRLLQQASTGKDSKGKKENYVENELESFLTKFNPVISNTSDNVRKELEGLFESMKAKRCQVKTNDKDSILILLDDARKLTRCITDIQMKNKLRV